MSDKIEPKGSPHYKTTKTIGAGDLNYRSHLGHDRLVAILHEARVEFFKTLSYDEIQHGPPKQIGALPQVGTVVADLQVQYFSEAFLGQTLVIDVTMDFYTSKGCLLSFIVMNETGGQVAKAQVSVVFFDYVARQAACLPEAFMSKVIALGIPRRPKKC